MAMNVGNGGRAARRGTRHRPMAEINVTPFVDVMLVLLVVFMVTAPLLTVGVPVDLPKTKAAVISSPDEPIVISIDAQNRVFIQETAVPLENLAVRLMAITGANPETRIFVRADKGIAYGTVMEVMGSVAEAGFSKVSLLANLPAGKKKK
ncbi:MAG: protein TolR [Alphaproteobacteria bacterium]|jgi:biopolymer transport protein TolR|nr:protein TolR [Alphaproteobacteria bacterium]MDH5557447.1 protein TolR [Alphaproteobacteria bacterium]